MVGHLFVVKGDLNRIMCDIRLLPTDENGMVETTWLGRPVGAAVDTSPQGHAGYLSRLQGYFEYVDGHSPHWLCNAAHHPSTWAPGCRAAPAPLPMPAGKPTAWLVNVGGHDDTELSWFANGVIEFLEAAGAYLANRPALHRRARPVVALHSLGLGGGGLAERKGRIFDILDVIGEFVDREACEIDVVFVALEKPVFAAAQAWRRARRHSETDWRELTGGQRSRADELARHAIDGNLVLFLGAGVSKPVGLPTWEQLISQAGGGAYEGVTDLLTRASLLDRTQAGFRDRIEDQVLTSHYGLGHGLLASLPVREVVTTNYDVLFEEASVAVGDPVRVIASGEDTDLRRWLLKLHGSVGRAHRDDPLSMVVTREDYIRYEKTRAALAGIVQALLLTRHMMFVGFSLDDPNFFRISFEVQQVIRNAEKHYATVLFLDDPSAVRSLYGEGMDFLWFGGQDGAALDVSESARRLEIFLDYLLFQSSQSASYLLIETFRDALSDDERELAEQLRELHDAFAARLHDNAAWKQIDRVLHDIGLSVGSAD